MINGMLLLWYLLTAGSLIFLIWDLCHNTPAMWVMKLAWILIVLYTGPIGSQDDSIHHADSMLHDHTMSHSNMAPKLPLPNAVGVIILTIAFLTASVWFTTLFARLML